MTQPLGNLFFQLSSGTFWEPRSDAQLIASGSEPNLTFAELSADNPFVGLFTTTSQTSETIDSAQQRQTKDARNALLETRRRAHAQAFETQAKAVAQARLRGIRQRTIQLVSSYQASKDSPRWAELKRLVQRGQALSARLSQRAQALQNARGAQPAIIGAHLQGSATAHDLDRTIKSAERDISELQKLRVQLYLDHPELALLNIERQDLDGWSPSLILERLKAGAARIQERISLVSEKINSGDIDVRDFKEVIAQVKKEQGISELKSQQGDLKSSAVIEWTSAHAYYENLRSYGVAVAAIVIGVGSAVATAGGALVAGTALGLTGAASGLGGAVYELEHAVDLYDASQASLPGDALVSPKAAKARLLMATIDLVLSGVDLGTAARALRTSAKSSALVLSYASRPAGAALAHLNPGQISRFEAAAELSGAARRKLLDKLQAEVSSPELFETAKTFFVERARTRKLFGESLPPNVFNGLHAQLGDHRLREISSGLNSAQLTELHSKLGLEVLGPALNRQDPATVLKIAQGLEPADATRVLETLGSFKPERVSAYMRQVDLGRLASLVKSLGRHEVHRQLGILGPRGLRILFERLEDAQALGLLSKKLKGEQLEYLREILRSVPPAHLQGLAAKEVKYLASRPELRGLLAKTRGQVLVHFDRDFLNKIARTFQFRKRVLELLERVANNPKIGELERWIEFSSGSRNFKSLDKVVDNFENDLRELVVAEDLVQKTGRKVEVGLDAIAPMDRSGEKLKSFDIATTGDGPRINLEVHRVDTSKKITVPKLMRGLEHAGEKVIDEMTHPPGSIAVEHYTRGRKEGALFIDIPPSTKSQNAPNKLNKDQSQHEWTRSGKKVRTLINGKVEEIDYFKKLEETMNDCGDQAASMNANKIDAITIYDAADNAPIYRLERAPATGRWEGRVLVVEKP